MRIRVIGGGWYGCHIALDLLKEGHDVELWERGDRLFSGASGANPARLHKGFHYPRSRLTRAACLENAEAFEREYGVLTRTIPCNVYAVAAHESLLDFGSYTQMLRGEVEFVTCERPSDLGLVNVEGAILTGERHVVIDQARELFAAALNGFAHYAAVPDRLDDPRWDWTIDCTFCALDAEAIDRYEPCVTVLLKGPTDRAVTIMDGPFPSIYPWNEAEGLCSLTSASLTPLSKTCRTWAEADAMIADALGDPSYLGGRALDMLDQIARFWPAARDLFTIADMRLAVRAMPKSGADARLVDLVQISDRVLRIRAGKIDAIFRAAALVKEKVNACDHRRQVEDHRGVPPARAAGGGGTLRLPGQPSPDG